MKILLKNRNSEEIENLDKDQILKKLKNLAKIDKKLKFDQI